jgi:RNA polymerase sigma-70 factor, ECF subfamily
MKRQPLQVISQEVKATNQIETLELSGAGSPVHNDLPPAMEGLNKVLENCLLSGDDALWTTFIHHSQPVLARVIVRALRRRAGSASPQLVDDLVQDAYLKLCANDFRALREFQCDHECAIYGFLKVVAMHVVHDHFRSSWSLKRGRGLEEVYLDQAISIHAGDTCGLSSTDKKILLREIRDFFSTRCGPPAPSRDCAIFWLYYRYGLTSKAIAGISFLGLSVKGVESALLRLRRQIRAEFEQNPTHNCRRSELEPAQR